jgi:hypothetical protein
MSSQYIWAAYTLSTGFDDIGEIDSQAQRLPLGVSTGAQHSLVTPSGAPNIRRMIDLCYNLP